MENKNKIFQCLLCKKFRHHSKLELFFDDGSPMCSICGNEIRHSFKYYIDGKDVTPEEFKKETNSDE